MNSQQENIKKHYNFLKEERVVTSKDVALKWILDIGLKDRNNNNTDSLKDVIDELMAYAELGLEQIE